MLEYLKSEEWFLDLMKIEVQLKKKGLQIPRKGCKPFVLKCKTQYFYPQFVRLPKGQQKGK